MIDLNQLRKVAENALPTWGTLSVNLDLANLSNIHFLKLFNPEVALCMIDLIAELQAEKSRLETSVNNAIRDLSRLQADIHIIKRQADAQIERLKDEQDALKYKGDASWYNR